MAGIGRRSGLLVGTGCAIADAQVKSNDEGLQALIFTAEGDMRQAINNLQSTWSGFGFVSADNVYKICDQPHPHKIRAMIRVRPLSSSFPLPRPVRARAEALEKKDYRC